MKPFTEEESIKFAKKLGWTDEQVEKAQKYQELKDKWDSLQKKDSFAGWALAGLLEKAAEVCDSYFCPELTLPVPTLARMYEIEEGMTDQEKSKYMAKLCILMKSKPGEPVNYLWHADGPTRGRAYLKL